jgi:hypothetical protein
MLMAEICGLVSVRHALWREDGTAICSVITQWSESRRTRNRTLLSHVRLPEPGGPGSRIYIPLEQGGPVIAPGTGFPLRRLLRLAGLRWRYSNPSPTWRARSPYIISLRNRMVQSKVKVTQYVLVPRPRDFRGVPSERISILHQEGYIKAKLLIC